MRLSVKINDGAITQCLDEIRRRCEELTPVLNGIAAEEGEGGGFYYNYAAVQTSGIFALVRVRSHWRRTRWGKTSVRSHLRKMKIAARPFMLVQDSDWKKINKAAVRHLMEG